MNWLIACFIVITGIAIYFPVIYIRKMNQILQLLHEIETNTRVAVGSALVQRLAPTKAERHNASNASSMKNVG